MVRASGETGGAALYRVTGAQAISAGICGACTGLIAGKPAPTVGGVMHRFYVLQKSLWELACQRWGQNRLQKNPRHKKTRTSFKARALSLLQAINAPARSAACDAAVRPRPTAVGRRR
ncbi:hypothetical protein EJA71_04605 [Pseudomonas sp. PB106]|nr:hypothetical protein EJA71_04605 [Pseudomonas sp. PB106]